MNIYKLYICVCVTCENLSKDQIEICKTISDEKIKHYFGDNFISEKAIDEDELNLHYGINSKKDLVGSDEYLLEVSEEWSDHLKGDRGLNLEQDIELSVRIVACDFTMNNYQSYVDGEYDTGLMSGGDLSEDYLNWVKDSIDDLKNTRLSKWLKG